MSFLIDFFKNLYPNNENISDNEIQDYNKVCVVTEDILKSVNLQPIKNIEPNPSRNAPPHFTKIDLRNLNKAQLNAILNVKLKPTPLLQKVITYEPRHPCLRELLSKRQKIV